MQDFIGKMNPTFTFQGVQVFLHEAKWGWLQKLGSCAPAALTVVPPEPARAVPAPETCLKALDASRSHGPRHLSSSES